jgi:hypothetical protein
MADGSNKEETGSQRTRQSTRNEVSNGFYKRCAYTRGNNKDKSSLQGNLAELGNNVYQYGTWDQGDRFTRTTEAITDYVGRDYSKEMWLLVKKQEENEPKELVMPDKEKVKSPFVMKTYETELKQYYFKKERKIWGAQSKVICDCKGTMHPEYEEQSGEPTGLQFDGSKWWHYQVIERLKRADVQKAWSAVWVLGHGSSRAEPQARGAVTFFKID